MAIALAVVLGLSIWGCYMCCCSKKACCCRNAKGRPVSPAAAPQVVYVVQAPPGPGQGQAYAGGVIAHAHAGGAQAPAMAPTHGTGGPGAY